MKLLLDTCVILWAALEPDRLTNSAKNALLAKDSQIFCSAVSTAEIACLCTRGRITLNTHWKNWLRAVIKLNNWEVLSISNEIMEEAFCLPEPFHADPADRVIAATARIERLLVVTGDLLLLDSPHVETLW